MRATITTPRLTLSQHVLAVMERHPAGIGKRRLARALNAAEETVGSILEALQELGLVALQRRLPGEGGNARYAVAG